MVLATDEEIVPDEEARTDIPWNHLHIGCLLDLRPHLPTLNFLDLEENQDILMGLLHPPLMP